MTPKQAARHSSFRHFGTSLFEAVRRACMLFALAGGFLAMPVQGAWAQGATGQGSIGQVSTGQGEQEPAGVLTPASAGDEFPDDEPWQPEVICPRDKIAPREYNRCLFDATRTSEQALEAALGRAMAAIAARSDLAPAQRVMWRRLLEEAQYRFLIFRNFDCQSVAPFEGARGIGNFEQRALCLIGTNRARADALEQRYRSPSASGTHPFVASVAPPRREDANAAGSPDAARSVAVAPPAGPEPQLGVWIHPTAPVVD